MKIVVIGEGLNMVYQIQTIVLKQALCFENLHFFGGLSVVCLNKCFFCVFYNKYLLLPLRPLRSSKSLEAADSLVVLPLLKGFEKLRVTPQTSNISSCKHGRANIANCTA